MLILILQSALRSLLLGLTVWTALKLIRLKDAATETLIWAGVLAVAFAMPFLTPLAVRGPILHLAAPAMMKSVPALSVGIVAPGSMAQADWNPFEAMGNAAAWLGAHASLLAWIVYGAIAAWNLVRLAAGLILSWRLYRDARPVTEDWATGQAIRCSDKVESPFSLGFVILIPPDYRQWSQSTRNAILAHEISHIRRGDFFLQLVALLYRGLFWFNPLAWWLTLRLNELAETASDEAAIRVAGDRTGYAEILIEASLRSHPPAALTAMAKGADIHRRIDRILSDEPLETGVGLPVRLAAVGILGLLSFAFAAARAEINPVAHHPLPVMVNGAGVPAATPFQYTAIAQPPAAQTPAVRPAAAASHPVRAAKALVQPREELREDMPNPRALLDEPDSVVLPTVIPVLRAGSKTGKTANPATLSVVDDGNSVYLAQPQ